MRTAARYRRRHQTIVPTASFRFYGALNDFLPPASRQATLVASFTSEAAIKDVVEALGVPHPEIDWLIVTSTGKAHTTFASTPFSRPRSRARRAESRSLHRRRTAALS
jgi:hypothetical protein